MNSRIRQGVPVFERWCLSLRHNRVCIRTLLFEGCLCGMSEQCKWYSCNVMKMWKELKFSRFALEHHVPSHVIVTRFRRIRNRELFHASESAMYNLITFCRFRIRSHGQLLQDNHSAKSIETVPWLITIHILQGIRTNYIVTRSELSIAFLNRIRHLIPQLLSYYLHHLHFSHCKHNYHQKLKNETSWTLTLISFFSFQSSLFKRIQKFELWFTTAKWMRVHR